MSISGGTVHELPKDLKQALISNPKALEAWETLTPLARNEWICWTISPKQQETRDEHVKRAMEELEAGERRPCCWYGCIHRTDKKVSASVQAVVIDRMKKK